MKKASAGLAFFSAVSLATVSTLSITAVDAQGATLSKRSSAKKAVSEFQHEFTGGTNAVISFQDAMTVALDGAYRYVLVPEIGMQIGYTMSFLFHTNDSLQRTDWLNLFAVRLNFPAEEKLNEAYFAELGIGPNFMRVANNVAASNAVEFAYQLQGGKRFQLGKKLSWVPSASLTKASSAADVRLALQPFAFSIFF